MAEAPRARCVPDDGVLTPGAPGTDRDAMGYKEDGMGRTVSLVLMGCSNKRQAFMGEGSWQKDDWGPCRVERNTSTFC